MIGISWVRVKLNSHVSMDLREFILQTIMWMERLTNELWSHLIRVLFFVKWRNECERAKEKERERMCVVCCVLCVEIEREVSVVKGVHGIHWEYLRVSPRVRRVHWICSVPRIRMHLTLKAKPLLLVSSSLLVRLYLFSWFFPSHHSFHSFLFSSIRCKSVCVWGMTESRTEICCLGVVGPYVGPLSAANTYISRDGGTLFFSLSLHSNWDCDSN
jgi:hypothetical protein